MGVKVSMSGNWERELKNLIGDTVQEVADDYQAMFDRLARRYKGCPIPEVKAALRREWNRRGGTISERELSDHAQLISDGTRIQMQVSHR